jgi:hypothetical protein
MKYITLLIIIMSLLACDKESAEEKFKRECPYPDAKINSHQLVIPVHLTPNQLRYKVGDTIRINATFSDTMYDYNANHHFVIRNFPFDVGLKLWRFENDSTFLNGFRENNFIIDSNYFQKYVYNEDHTDVMYFDFVEEDNMYKFDMKIVLDKKGRYLFQLEDFIARYPSKTYDIRILPYTFEGKCPTFGIRPVCMLQGGDDHLDKFVPELLYIDKKLSYDNWSTIKVDHANKTPFGSGSYKWEFVSTYGFIVE